MQPQFITASSVILRQPEGVAGNFELEKIEMGRKGHGLTNHLAEMKRNGIEAEQVQAFKAYAQRCTMYENAILAIANQSPPMMGAFFRTGGCKMKIEGSNPVNLRFYNVFINPVTGIMVYEFTQV